MLLRKYYHSTMVPWYRGTIVPRYHGNMVPWYDGTMVQWYHGTMVPEASPVFSTSAWLYVIKDALVLSYVFRRTGDWIQGFSTPKWGRALCSGLFERAAEFFPGKKNPGKIAFLTHFRGFQAPGGVPIAQAPHFHQVCTTERLKIFFPDPF